MGEHVVLHDIGDGSGYCSRCIDTCLNYLSVCNSLMSTSGIEYTEKQASLLTRLELEMVQELVGRFQSAIEEEEQEKGEESE